MIKNDFFYIVGTPKSGTTSLYAYLKQHTDIFLPEQKELHFFSWPDVDNTYYSSEAMVKTIEEYSTHYKNADSNQVCGDISPSYLYYKNTANKIYQFKQDAKIIIILRDPVERAISHYLMDKREGYVDVELMDILMEPKKYPSFYKEYVETGKYYNQINEYYDVFPKEQIKLLKYESFFSDLEKNIDELYTFLEINNNIKIELKNRMNTYKVTRFNIKKYYREYKIINFVGSLFPASFRRRVLQNFIYKDSDKLPFGKERDIMQEIFKEHNKKLFSKYDISY